MPSSLWSGRVTSSRPESMLGVLRERDQVDREKPRDESYPTKNGSHIYQHVNSCRSPRTLLRRNKHGGHHDIGFHGTRLVG